MRPKNEGRIFHAKRWNSKGSRLDGKINENDMLPLAEELSNEELMKYQF